MTLGSRRAKARTPLSRALVVLPGVVFLLVASSLPLGLSSVGGGSGAHPSLARPLGTFASPATMISPVRPGIAMTVFPAATVNVRAHLGTLPVAPTFHGPLPLGPKADAQLRATESFLPSTTQASPHLETPAPAAPNLWYSTDGLTSTQSGGVYPPDVQIATGPTQEVELVNLEAAFYNLTGATLGSEAISTLFADAPGSNLGDVKILYDNQSHRWFASSIHINSAGTAAYNNIAVSSSSDALGTWTTYLIADATGDFGDQPILGLGNKTVSISVNEFQGNSFAGAHFWVVNKSSMLSGGPISVAAFGIYGTDSSIHPVYELSPNPYTYLVETSIVSATRLTFFNASGVPPATVTVSQHNLVIQSLSPPPSAPQPGTSDQLDTGQDYRVQTAVQMNDQLWLTFGDSCRPSGDSSTRACFRLVEVAPSTFTVLQDFAFGVNGAYLLYPAIALDPKGDLTVVYAESSSTIYPSLEVTGRLATDPAGSLESSVLMQAGSGSITGCGGVPCRYGDYFGAGFSPIGTGAWVAGEYIDTTDLWSTHFAQVRSVSVPPAPLLTATPAVIDAGQSVHVSFSLSNSPCVNLTGARCTLHLPVGATSIDLACVSPFSGTSANVSLASVGSYTFGSGGYLAVYPAPGCSGSPTQNLSLTAVPVSVHARPLVGVSVSPFFPTEVRQAFTLHATVSGGVGSFTYRWSALPTGCFDSQLAVLTCVPTGVSAGTLALAVTDGVGVGALATFGFQILPNPSANLVSTTSALEPGMTTELTATASGGIGALTYTWVGLPSGCRSANTSDLFCQPDAAGQASVTVSVRDGNGFAASSNGIALVVYPLPSVNISASTTHPTFGGTVNLTAVTTGGTGNFTYGWSGLPAGCSSEPTAWILCTSSVSGTFRIVLTVTDSLGGHATASTNLTVGPRNSPPPSTLPLTNNDLYIGLGVAIAVALAALLVAATRRRPPPPKRPVARPPRTITK
ncbi:MAG: hypothetical protein L3J97_00840 [Thermoplasmata archaeon]|nr:hypothetical protein [Thermoplasmata archaeon]